MTTKQMPGDPLAVPMDELRRLGHALVDMAVDHMEALEQRERPVFRRMSEAERGRLFGAALPEEGAAPQAILEFLRDAVLPFPMGNGHPRFFGWVNSAPAPLAALTELLAATLNPSCAGGDHAGVYLEHAALRWLMDLCGFAAPGSGAAGLLTAGGSTATLTGLAAARQRACERLGIDVRAAGLGDARLVVYTSREGHSCLRKAAELLGLGAPRTVAVDGDLRMDLGALEAAIREDRAAGRTPFCVAASAGTVNSGAVDPLAALGALCRRHDLWLHVDGAYGGVAAADPALAALFAGMGEVDSLAVDPHKWLGVPVACGCALVRDGALLRRTFSLVPPYLRDAPSGGFGNLPWFSEFGFDQTRPLRALKLFVTLSQLGRRGAADLIARHRALAQRLAGQIDAAPDFERAAPTPLSIVCFRYRPPGMDDDACERLNAALVPIIQEGGAVFLTGSKLGERAVLRACVLHRGTKEEDIDAVLPAVRAAAQKA